MVAFDVHETCCILEVIRAVRIKCPNVILSVTTIEYNACCALCILIRTVIYNNRYYRLASDIPFSVIKQRSGSVFVIKCITIADT